MSVKPSFFTLSVIAGVFLSSISVCHAAISAADYQGLEVRFRSAHGFYLTGTYRDGEKARQNNGPLKQPYDVWLMVDQGNGTVLLQNRANGRFLSANSDGSVEAQTSARAWEFWKLGDNGDGTVSLVSNAFQRYLRAMPEGPQDASGFFNAPVTQSGSNEAYERWKIEPVFKIQSVKNLQYQYEQAERSGDQPIVIGDIPAATNNTSVMQTMSMSFRKAIRTASSFTQTSGVSVGAGASVTVGIPEVGEAEVHVNAEVKHEWSSGMEQSVEHEVAFEFPVSVPPFGSVTGQVTGYETALTVPWTATAVCVTSNGNIVEKRISGVWKGVSLWRVHPEWR